MITPLTQERSERIACIRNAIHYSMRLSIQLISTLHQLIIAAIKFVLNTPKDKVENHTPARRTKKLQQNQKTTSYR